MIQSAKVREWIEEGRELTARARALSRQIEAYSAELERQQGKLTGRKANPPEIWTLKEALYLARLERSYLATEIDRVRYQIERLGSLTAQEAKQVIGDRNYVH